MNDFKVYIASIWSEYRARTWRMSRTAAQMMDLDQARSEAEEVIRIYTGMSGEEQDQLCDKKSPLLSQFDEVRDDGFEETRAFLRMIQESSDGIAAFTAFIDPETNRRIFITDSDPKDSFCPPGSWDELPAGTIDALMNGKRYPIDRFMGLEEIPAAEINMKPYGFRCTAGTLLFEIDGYPVFVLFDTDLNQAVRTCWQLFICFEIVLIVILALAAVTIMNNIKKTITLPIYRMAGAAKRYTKDRSGGRHNGDHFSSLNIHTGDEIEYLASTMNSMEHDMDAYLSELVTVTAKNERIVSELSLAKSIQESMLPHTFPPFPDRKEFDLYATMTPAKEIGGDFYDFFLVDDDHLGLVMADVSGKGVPGALFMMVSKVIVQSCAMLGRSAGEILTKTNEAICSNNQAGMFVTVWVGILEISTGKLTAANAGHEYPAIRYPGGCFELFKDRHGFVIGGMDGIVYKEYELQLEPGTKIFVYTDGVPEAMNVKGKMFGIDRMLVALNKEPDASPEDTLRIVRRDVDDFVQEAEQFDDLTMMCIEYRGK